MNESGGRTPQTKEEIHANLYNGFDVGRDLERNLEFDLVERRLRGLYEDIKGVLSDGEHDERHRRWYFTATALGTLINYLDEHEGGGAEA